MAGAGDVVDPPPARITVDLSRLEDGELQELDRLGEKVLGRQGWERLDREPFALSWLSEQERARFETLVAKAAGEPGLFERMRKDESLRRQLVELARRARPAERVVVREPGRWRSRPPCSSSSGSRHPR